MARIDSAEKYGDDVVIGSIMDGTITEYVDSAVETIRTYVFGNCKELEHVDISSVTKIDSGVFIDCSKLSTLVLRNTSMASLGSNALKNTPIAKNTGYIYVPRSLVDSYKAATNWSTYAAQFRALEDYTVDGTVDGDIDMSKI